MLIHRLTCRLRCINNNATSTPNVCSRKMVGFEWMWLSFDGYSGRFAVVRAPTMGLVVSSTLRYDRNNCRLATAIQHVIRNAFGRFRSLNKSATKCGRVAVAAVWLASVFTTLRPATSTLLFEWPIGICAIFLSHSIVLIVLMCRFEIIKKTCFACFATSYDRFPSIKFPFILCPSYQCLFPGMRIGHQ